MRPAMVPASNESHSGTPRPLTSSSACWIAGFCALRSLDADRVARLDRVGRDVDLAAVDREVAVAHQLPRLRPRGGEAEAVDHVVEAALQQLEQRLAGDAARAVRHLEVAAELVLEHAVDALDLLLLAQLQAVADDLRLAQLAVLAGGHVALLDRALLGVAALSLEEELHAFAPAEPTNRSGITCHLYCLVVQFPTSQLPTPNQLPIAIPQAAG